MAQRRTREVHVWVLCMDVCADVRADMCMDMFVEQHLSMCACLSACCAHVPCVGACAAELLAITRTSCRLGSADNGLFSSCSGMADSARTQAHIL